MTIGRLQTASQDSSDLTPLMGNPTSYASLTEDPDERVVKDTIYLYDLAYALPNRCQRRRQAFQALQNRYFRQILYGCTNPRCETPTCLSHQKRVSKGPFRPYTASSARTLAAILASEDHPENGLCPYRPISSPVSSGLKLIFKDTQYIKKSPGLSGRPSRNLTSTRKEPPSYNGSVKAPGNGHLENLCKGAPELAQKVIKNKKTSEAPERVHEGKMAQGVKDTKSFAQSLFDTAAMKLLYFGSIHQSVLGWVGMTELDRHGNASDEANHQRNMENEDVPFKDSSDDEGQHKLDAEEPCILEQSADDLTNAGDVHRESSSPGFLHYCLGLNGDSRAQSLPMVTVDSDANLISQSGSHGLTNGTIAPEPVQNTTQNGSAAIQHQRRSPKFEDGKPPSADGNKVNSNLQAQGQKTKKVQVSSDGVLHNAVSFPQSLSHFSLANIEGLVKTIKRKHFDTFKEHCFLRSRGRIDFPIPSSTCSLEKDQSYRAMLAFSAQSMTYVLSNVEALMQSFLHRDLPSTSRMAVSPYRLHTMVYCFSRLGSLDFHPQRILPSLWISASHIYPLNSIRKKTASIQNVSPLLDGLNDPLNDLEASHITKVIFAALIARVPTYELEVMDAVAKLHAIGQTILPPQYGDPPYSRRLHKRTLNTVMVFENEMTLNVVKRLVRAIAARHQETSRKCDRQYGVREGYIHQTVDDLLSTDFKISVANNQACPSLRGGELISQDRLEIAEHVHFPCRMIIEWLRTTILKEWDGKALVRKCSAVGGALQLLKEIFLRKWVGIFDVLYQTPFLSERLDLMEVPLEWIDSEQDDAFVHLLSYPFLFPLSVLLSYFRAINYDAMYKAFEGAAMAENLVERMTFTDRRTNRGTIRFEDRLRIAQTSYLVLEVRREDVLTEAMDQLWRRQTPELMKPLKVRMGMDEGEEGVDHGGVQQEFFRVAIAEALDPKYGAFTTDTQTHMSWFQPGSLEPLYKFELLGLLTSLAVYNGLTLPFSFPRAFYSKLLGLPVTSLADIEDGWPELAKGLRTLRDWPEDNVEEIFARPFVFSVDVFGTAFDVDLDKAQYFGKSLQQGKKSKPQRAEEEYEKGKALSAHPTMETEFTHKMALKSPESKEKLRKAPRREAINSPNRDTLLDSSAENPNEDEAFHKNVRPASMAETKPHSSPELIMVTNSNRHEYIRRYIAHLTHHSIQPQFASFSRGFFTCISRKSITLFSPSQLKHIVEGLPNVSIPDLQRITKYEGGYHALHPTILLFWTVVRTWSQEKVRRLLEFVTASDRLPAQGVERVTFVVQRNGSGEGRWLPTSLTCFGRLLLPEYKEEGLLREGLETAVENSKGFGQP